MKYKIGDIVEFVSRDVKHRGRIVQNNHYPSALLEEDFNYYYVKGDYDSTVAGWIAGRDLTRVEKEYDTLEIRLKCKIEDWI